MQIRRATPADVPAIARIAASAPGAAHWKPADYLAYDCWVAEEAGRVAGFLVSRPVVDDREILNMAVAPEFRRRGTGEALVRNELAQGARAWFLEVRESNAAARRLYRKTGFTESGERPGYYSDPYESAVVMSIFS